MPNKLTSKSVNQIAFSRSARGKKTLILMKEPDPSISYPTMVIGTSSEPIQDKVLKSKLIKNMGNL
jgi:hypothetical protein